MEACDLISSMDQTLQKNSRHLPWSNNSQSLSIRYVAGWKGGPSRGRSRKMGANMCFGYWPHLLSCRAPGYFAREVWIGRGSPPKRYENAGSAQFPAFLKIYTGACNCSGNSSVGAQNGSERFCCSQNGSERFCCSRPHVFAWAGPTWLSTIFPEKNCGMHGNLLAPRPAGQASF